ncbi:MAG TPA: L-histidine N(alpha)-methyltransferase [Gammaproteobacteria bacterium]|nr:L-histidine N(alpha)-methyltransferase [Gammaproteobacteria bacterium]
MTTEATAIATGNSVAPELVEYRDEILKGLTAPQKRLSPKYLYDRRGSELFDRICSLPEYYPTRTELKLMESHLDEVAGLVGERAAVIEFGAGSNVKVRLLLDHLREPAAYVPVDISPEFLLEQVESLRPDYPDVHMQPVFADFTRPFELPEHPVEPLRNLVFFPGSTIGNFTRPRALEVLEVMAAEAKPGGALLIGVDLRKDPAILYAAYNDAEGVTAEFNLNLLARLNRELDAEFDLERFAHHAHYDEHEHRIEMRLISACRQRIKVAGVPIEFMSGEYIITEYSHKYSPGEFHALAERAGFAPCRTWIDDDRLFSLQFMTVPNGG